MALKIFWEVPQRVITIQISHNLTLEELVVMNTQMIAHLPQGSPPIHLLFNLVQVESYPADINTIKNTLTYLESQKIGWVLIIGGEHPLGNLISNLILQLARVNFHFFSTPALALQHLWENDPTLELPDPNNRP